MKDKWKELTNEIDEFLYGEMGLETIAYSDRDLNTYKWDLDKIIGILKQIKKMEKNLTQAQKEKLNSYKEVFLQIDNKKNGIEKIYTEINNIYKNIEEY